MKVGFAELGKKFILSKYPRNFLVRTENPKISSKDLVRTENPKDILERFGPDKRSKRYPRKILGWTKDPEDILERFWGGQKIQKIS